MTYSSRLLQSLDQQIQQCTDRTERSRLISRRAIYLGRLNHLEKAKEEIANLRSELGPAMDPISGAWVLLAEGIIGYFDLDIDRSFDRLRRSHGISQSANASELIAASSAWLAQINYQKSDYEAANSCLKQSISHAAPDDSFSRCRTSLVAANFLGLANMSEDARVWQQRARFHATTDGDETSLAALLLNTATFRVNEARLAHAFGQQLPSDFANVKLELDSSLTFDALAKGIGLPSSPIILKGYILCIENRYPEAIERFEAALEIGIFTTDQASVQADLTLSNAKLGNLESAKLHYMRTIEALGNIVDHDDIAYVHARLAQYCLSYEPTSDYSEHLKKANQAIIDFRNFQETIRLLMLDLPNPLLV